MSPLRPLRTSAGSVPSGRTAPASPAPCVTINGTDTAFFRSRSSANDARNETFLADLWSGLNVTLNRALSAKTSPPNGTWNPGSTRESENAAFDFAEASPSVAGGCRRWRNVSVAVPTGRFGACVVDVPSTRVRGAVSLPGSTGSRAPSWTCASSAAVAENRSYCPAAPPRAVTAGSTRASPSRSPSPSARRSRRCAGGVGAATPAGDGRARDGHRLG